VKRLALLVTSLLVTTVLGLTTYPVARYSLAGSREFNQWLGVTTSNKTWLWLISILIIGGCLGYIVRKLAWKRKS
jgi:hypothetical protein